MPIRKFYRRSKRRSRRKYSGTKRNYKFPSGRIMRMPRVGGIHSFKCRTSLTGIDPSNIAGEIARQYTFDITQIPNNAEYKVLFDQYKITGIKMEFRLKKQPGTLGATSVLPVMASIVDRDGAPNVENTYGTLLLREGTRITYFSDTVPYVKYFFRPKVLSPTLNGDFTVNPPTFAISGRQVTRPQWQDFGSTTGTPPAQQHYGMLVSVLGAGVGISAAAIDVYQTIYFKCRNQL